MGDSLARQICTNTAAGFATAKFHQKELKKKAIGWHAGSISHEGRQVSQSNEKNWISFFFRQKWAASNDHPRSYLPELQHPNGEHYIEMTFQVTYIPLSRRRQWTQPN